MKKTIVTVVTLVIVIMNSNVNASEVIGGFEMGGKINSDMKARKIKKENRVNPLSHNQYGAKAVKLFDIVLIGTNKDDNIESLMFMKTYKLNSYTEIAPMKSKIKNNFVNLHAHLSTKYGKFNASQARTMFNSLSESTAFYMGAVYQYSQNTSPNSKYVGAMSLVLEGKGIGMHGGEITMTLNYWSPEMYKRETKKANDKISDF